MLETNVEDVSFWDKNADLQELRLRQGQTLKVTDKKKRAFIQYLSGLFEICSGGALPYITHTAMCHPKG